MIGVVLLMIAVAAAVGVCAWVDMADRIWLVPAWALPCIPGRCMCAAGPAANWGGENLTSHPPRRHKGIG
jgi:hypothetical protein